MYKILPITYSKHRRDQHKSIAHHRVNILYLLAQFKPLFSHKGKKKKMLISVSKGPPSLRRWTKILPVFHSSDSFVRLNAFSGYQGKGQSFFSSAEWHYRPVSQSQRLNRIWENPDHIFSWKFIQHLIFSSSWKKNVEDLQVVPVIYR